MAAKGQQCKEVCNPPIPVCQDQTSNCPEPCKPIPVCQDKTPKCPDQDPCVPVNPCQTQGKEKHHGVKQ